MHNLVYNEDWLIKFEEQDFLVWKTKCPFSISKETEIKLYNLFARSASSPIELATGKSAGKFNSSWNIDKTLQQWDDFVPFVSWIESKFPGHRVTEMWANVTEPGGFLKNHTHDTHKYAGTWYIKVPPNSGDIVMRQYCRGHIEEGDLIIFDGKVAHKTRPNLSNEDRVVVAFTLDEV